MIWQNPWGLAGLLTLALPVLIHLLSRTKATIQKFPTLRFLGVSRLLPTRSPRITDIPLLLIRMGIFAAAALALAAPLFLSAARTQEFNAAIARAIVVDTSRSVSRASSNSIDSLSAQASRFALGAATSSVLRTNNVDQGVADAITWLSTQHRRSEIIVLSDFQTSSVDSAALAAVPKQYGVKLVRTASAGAVANRESAPSNTLHSQSGIVAIATDPNRTVATWSVSATAAQSKTDLLLFAADAEKTLAESARQVALQIVAPPVSDTSMAIAIVYAGSPEFSALTKSATPLNKTWMGEFIQRLTYDNAFRSAMRTVENVTDTTVTNPLFVVARNSVGHALVFAARDNISNRDRLVLFARIGAGTVASAQLIAAAYGASASAWTASEQETRTLSDATLMALEREAMQVAPARASINGSAGNSASDARWFWAIALMLLALEAYMRRERTRVAVSSDAMA
jgi:hypothetical protein